MEMFNKKELDKRIGPLKKSKGLYDLEAVEGYVIRKCGENGLEHSYDVLAEEMQHLDDPNRPMDEMQWAHNQGWIEALEMVLHTLDDK